MLAWAFAMAAWAQEPTVPELNVQAYRAPVDARATLWTDSAGRILADPELRTALALHYAMRPLAWRPDDGSAPVWLVSDVLQADAVVAVAYDRFRLGAYVPVLLYGAGALTPDGAGLGDLGVDGRLTFFDAVDQPLGLALHARVRVPTATSAVPLGAGAADAEVFLAATHRIAETLELSANLGLLAGPRRAYDGLVLDDLATWRVGGGYALGDGGGLSLDLAGRAALSGAGVGSPVEALAGGWFQAGREVAVKLGLGRGLTQGIGTPQLRTLASVAYQPRGASDRDRDGLVDRYDVCPNEPEDLDGYQDGDGCPDVDDDGDGILDVADRCTREPEDVDGFRDGDGCPDPSQRLAIQVQGPAGRVLGEAQTRIEGDQSGLVGQGFWLAELHEGAFVVHATAPGYLPGRVAFTVPYDGERVVVVLQPAAALGDLAVTVIDPMGLPIDGATLAVDGGPPRAVAPGALFPLTAGSHALMFAAPGFQPSATEVVVPEGGVVEHLLLMEPLEAP